MKKSKNGQIKKVTATLAKKKAWAVFSKFIRLKYADKDDNCVCVTCKKKDHWKKFHSGHFIDGRNNTVLYDERLVYPQDFHCNSKRPGCLGGNKVAYTIFMMEEKGHTLEEIKEFQSYYFTSKPMTADEHFVVLEKYKVKLNNLIKERKNGKSIL